MSIVADWPDVWLEYQKIFGHFGLTSEKAAAEVVFEAAARMPSPDVDRVADALKEFAVRAQERGVPVSGLRVELARVKGSLESTHGGMHRAATLFGTAAEDLGIAALRLLAERVVPSERERH